jgi:hypothetical protein
MSYLSMTLNKFKAITRNMQQRKTIRQQQSKIDLQVTLHLWPHREDLKLELFPQSLRQEASTMMSIRQFGGIHSVTNCSSGNGCSLDNNNLLH